MQEAKVLQEIGYKLKAKDPYEAIALGAREKILQLRHHGNCT
jgi:hypothetical protein